MDSLQYRPNLRPFLFFGALVLWLLGAGPGTGVLAATPNILFILADDLGWQDTSMALGPSRTATSSHYRTPAIERLARDGMKFTQAYSCAVCSPTRVSFMTGLNEARHGVTQWTSMSGSTPSTDLPHPTIEYAPWKWNGLQPTPGLAASVSRPTLPALLRDAGYRTMIFGKGHLGAAGTPGADPKEFGFEVRIGGRDAGGIGSYWGTKHFGAKANPNTLFRARDLDHYWGQDIHFTEALTREATREIRAAVADKKPFFCYFAHFAPHTPIEPDERFAPAYRAGGLDAIEAAYASLIAGMDKSVGDLLALLDELGIADNTLVVFTSDNGGLSHSQRSMEQPHAHNAPLSSGKGAHHEGGIRVPLAVRWPGVIKAGAISAEPVIIYDWTRTLLECGGAKAPAVLDGRNVLPILRGERAALPERSLVWHFPNFWGPLRRPGPVEGPGMGLSRLKLTRGPRKNGGGEKYHYTKNF
jgi:arylsulfatase A-like enzyme